MEQFHLYFWMLFFFVKRRIITFVSLFFILGGVGLIALSYLIPLQSDLFMGLGTEFFGGVLVLIIFGSIQLRVKETKGINYFILEKNFQRVRSRIRILTTFSYLFCDDKRIGSEVDIEKVKRCSNALKRIVRMQPEIDIEILILDPTSQAAQARLSERNEIRNQINIIDCIWNNLQHLQDWVNRYSPSDIDRSSLKVKVYNTVPRISLIQWDDNLSVSFFERDKSISISQRTEFSIEHPLGKFLADNFDYLWNDTLTKDLEIFLTEHNEEFKSFLKK